MLIDRLKVIGPFRGTTGYDRHTRELVRALARLGVTIELASLEGWSSPMPPAHRDPWFETLRAPVDADVVIHFAMPPQARAVRGKRNVNFTMFEADAIPPSWAEHARSQQRIIVPTESSRVAWARSGVPEDKLGVCPLGVDSTWLAREAGPLPLRTSDRDVSSYRSRFLNIGELRPRKNQLGLIRAWLSATDARDDAVLVMKLSVYHPRALALFELDLKEMLQRTGRSLQDAAPVVFITGTLSDPEMRSLYATATHYVSLSRGEGWDLPMLEAAAAGLRLVAPDHSAYRAYLRDEDAELVPSVGVPAAFEGRMAAEDAVLFRGLNWWQPDEEAAAHIVRRIVRGEAAAKASPRDRIVAEYTWQRAAERLLALL